MYWPLESCKDSDVISSRNKGLHAHAHTNWLFGGDWQLRFRLFWLHWFTKIIIWLYFYASWWSYILEKCQVDLDCYFHYGGWVCFLFWGYLAWLWLKIFVSRLRVVDSISRPLKLYCDNSVAIFMAKNNKSGSRSKHIDIKYLAIRERVKEKKVVFEHISTELMIVDPLTKDMPPKNFKYHLVRVRLGSMMWFHCSTIGIFETLI